MSYGRVDGVALDHVDDDNIPDHPDDVQVSHSCVDRLRAEAVSISHLLTHIPKNPYCQVCIFAKTLRAQQRKKTNKGLHVIRPYSNPTSFGGLCTMDHWFVAKGEGSRGLHGETACVTFRDRFTNYLGAKACFDKSTASVCNFLINFVRRDVEQITYCYTDGARELQAACQELKIAHDATVPGNKRQNCHAERTNGIVQVGARALMLQAGLPAPFWPYAIEYYCLSYNLQSRGGEPSPWIKRFGTEFMAPMLPFGSTVRYMPQPNSMITRPKLDSPTNIGIFLGYVRKAGDSYGDVSRVCPLSELVGLNMFTGKKPKGFPPTIEQSTQIFSNILGTLADEVADRSPRFPMKEAFDKARSSIAHVTIPDGIPPPGFRRPDVLPPLAVPQEDDNGETQAQADDVSAFQEDLFEDDDDTPRSHLLEDDRHVPDD